MCIRDRVHTLVFSQELKAKISFAECATPHSLNLVSSFMAEKVCIEATIFFSFVQGLSLIHI